MHGGARTWLARLLATLVIWCGGHTARAADDWRMSPDDDPAYRLPVVSPVRAPGRVVPGRLVSSAAADPAPDLQDRVTKLEAALRKYEDKDAEAKKKAAGRMSVKAGGRIMLDWGLFGQGPASRDVYGDVQDGVEFRRARLFLSGEGFDVVEYKIQFDFADTDTGFGGKTIQSTSFKDVYLAVKELPYVGHVKVGHYKEPFGLEQLTSSKYITFMERSMGDEGAFVPGRRIGVMAYDTYAGENGTWAIGAFRNKLTNGGEPPFRKDDDGGTALTTRLTYLPWFDEATDGRGLVHVGMAYSYRNNDDHVLSLQSRPEAHLGPHIVEADITDVPEWHLVGAELATVYGPLSFQTEYYAEWVPRTGGLGTAYLHGYYAYVSWFLTGENRRYDRAHGSFGRVHPFTNFFRVRARDGVQTGWGAWELAYRFDHVDFVDLQAGVDGGLADAHTVGLNWYLNPYTRLMWNYVLARSTPETATPLTDMSVFEMRCQIEF